MSLNYQDHFKLIKEIRFDRPFAEYTIEGTNQPLACVLDCFLHGALATTASMHYRFLPVAIDDFFIEGDFQTELFAKTHATIITNKKLRIDLDAYNAQGERVMSMRGIRCKVIPKMSSNKLKMPTLEILIRKPSLITRL